MLPWTIFLFMESKYMMLHMHIFKEQPTSMYVHYPEGGNYCTAGHVHAQKVDCLKCNVSTIIQLNIIG